MAKKGCNCGGRFSRRILSNRTEQEGLTIMVEMDKTLVPANITGALPVNIILPLKFHAELGIPRRMVISRADQRIPQAVRDWLAADKHFAGRFTESAPETPVPAESAPESKRKPESGGKAPEKQPVETEAKWRRSWNVPQLRDFAEAQGLELTNADRRRDDLIARLIKEGFAEAPVEDAPPAEATEAAAKAEPEAVV